MIQHDWKDLLVTVMVTVYPLHVLLLGGTEQRNNRTLVTKGTPSKVGRESDLLLLLTPVVVVVVVVVVLVGVVLCWLCS